MTASRNLRTAAEDGRDANTATPIIRREWWSTATATRTPRGAFPCDVVNPDQNDTDGDGQGDVCDACPNDPLNDFDGDGLCCADEDGDGTVDDACCFSNLNGTVITPDGCNSGVPNAFFANGCTMNDLIAQCAASASNHGQFVSCVAHLTDGLKAQGVITGRQKSRIQRCAAHSNPNPASLVIRTVNERQP